MTQQTSTSLFEDLGRSLATDYFFLREQLTEYQLDVLRLGGLGIAKSAEMTSTARSEHGWVALLDALEILTHHPAADEGDDR